MSLIPFQAGYDIHGDMQDPDAVRAFFDFAAIWKPKIRVCGGDLWNFAPLRKGASEDERRQSLRADLKAGKDWFNRFKPTIFLRGNHDERLFDLAANGVGIASDMAQEGVGEIEAMVKHHKCLMLPYHKSKGIYRLGDTNLLHGFYHGINAVRQTATLYHTSICGHTHSIDEYAAPGLERKVAKIVGALCQTDMDYNSRQPNTLRQENGWAFGYYNDRTHRLHTWQARRLDGKWLLPSDFIEL